MNVDGDVDHRDPSVSLKFKLKWSMSSYESQISSLARVQGQFVPAENRGRARTNAGQERVRNDRTRDNGRRDDAEII
jgi:hypothetical protein